jgi:hypothetical protein
METDPILLLPFLLLCKTGGYVFNDDVAPREAVYRRIRWGNDYNVKRKGLARKLA